VTSAPFAITSRTPYRLVRTGSSNGCDPTWGYLTYINYTMQDNLLATFPSTIYITEAWTTGIVPDYSGTNWIRGTAGNLPSTNSTFADKIGGQAAGYTPSPNCNGPTTPVDHWGQAWFIGSPTSGQGTKVQDDTLQKYINSANHLIP
jgi:hypothetical protein